MKKLAVLLYLMSLHGALAERLPGYVSTLVNDYANLIPEAEEAALGEKLAKLREQTGVEMVVLTIQSRADYDHGGNLQVFSTDLFNEWGIGDSDRNDGVLVLVVNQDREMRLALGEGYDQGYDRVARWVISEHFTPDFRKDDYAGGIENGVKATISQIIEPHLRGETPDDVELYAENDGWFARYWALIAAVVIAALLKFRKKIARFIPSAKRCPQCGRHKVFHDHETITAATTTAQGQRRSTQRCYNCNYTHTRHKTISKRGKRSSGSRRSFGGGAIIRWRGQRQMVT